MMKNLHFREIFKSFLYDLDDFITIYENHIHIFNYQKLNKLSNTEIDLNFKKFRINIIGTNLKIKKMTKQELLIIGIIERLDFIYE